MSARVTVVGAVAIALLTGCGHASGAGLSWLTNPAPESCEGRSTSMEVSAALARARQLSLAGSLDAASSALRAAEASASDRDRFPLRVALAKVAVDKSFYQRADFAGARSAIAAARASAAPAGCIPSLELKHLEARVAFSEALTGRRDFFAARTGFQQVAAQARTSGPRAVETDAHFYLALVHQFAGEQAEMRSELEWVLARTTADHDLLEQSYAERHLGGLEDELGRLDLAERHFRESLRLRQAEGFVIGEAFALETLGEFLIDRRHAIPDGLALLERASEIARRTGAFPALAGAQLARARTLNAQGRSDEARIAARESAKAAALYGDPSLEREANAFAATIPGR